jgi:DNA modification methylase
MPNTSTEIAHTTLWKLGDHRLLLGDATKAEDVTRLMEGEKATLILSDPPYGVGYVEGKQEFLATIHKDSTQKKFSVIAGDAPEDDYYDFSKRWLEAVRPHLSPKNAFYIFNGDTKLRDFLNALHDARYRRFRMLS